MNNIAVLLTCFNRRVKTLSCLDSLMDSYIQSSSSLKVHIFLTDDGCTDGTVQAVNDRHYPFPVHILYGDGSLFWNGGMIKSWKAALTNDNYDGFLWLNDDTKILPVFWKELIAADKYSVSTSGKGGIYVGSTYDPITKDFTYGGFDFTNKWTLKDRFVIPDGTAFKQCQCAHGNITYVSRVVVEKMGIFCDKYIHGASDHDYTYRAYLSGFPILVMREYAGSCENDHKENETSSFHSLPFKKRIAYLKSPFGYNLHNTLLFQKRCFPHRYVFVGLMGYMKALFPKTYFRIYKVLRS